MAEKQLAYRSNGKDEIFADDDPLAELARIVGFEPRPSTPAVPANQRHEPAFDLEDELLREFERYDAPHLGAVDEITVEPEDEPLYAEAAYAQPGNENTPRTEPQRHTEPEFTELAPEASSAEAEPDASAELYEDAQTHEWAEEALSSDQPLYEPEDVTDAVAPAEEAAVAHEPAARDLADELEMSIASAPAVQPAARTPQWAAASIRLPLANFNAPRKPPEPIAVAAPAAESDAAAPLAEGNAEYTSTRDIADDDFVHEPPTSELSFPAEQDRHEDVEPQAFDDERPATSQTPIFDLAAAAERGDVDTDAALTEPAYETPADDFDDLLADVSRYAMPTRGDAATTKAEPAPVAAQSDPVPAQAVPETVAARAEEPAATVADDPFVDQDFDFDFEGIEMELAGLDFTEPNKPAEEPVIAPSLAAATASLAAVIAAPLPQRSLATPVAAPRAPPALRPELAARPAFAPILTLPPATSAPVQVAIPADVPKAPKAVIPAFDADQPLPFDPSEITDTEDRLEAFDGKSVPVLPHVEKEEPVAASPDYDFDIDAELANLFSAAPKETPRASASVSTSGDPATSAATGAAKPTTGKTGAELDEFERALEEDFRRSFNEPQQQEAPQAAARMSLESSSETTDRVRARSMRGMAIAAGAVLVLGAGAYGVYGFLSHGSSLGLSSGEPRVITADKEPIKVVPENPGGKVVPNQDKAVYDRVAGDATQTPKQKQLVSSNEQPVDVVQKTLIPEAMSPDDSDGGAGDGNDQVTATPVGETEDPRLLPAQANANDAANTPNDGEDAPSVSPRKVRTMIVKPDGTLVARDDPAPAADTSAKAATPATAARSQLAPATAAANSAPSADKLASANLRTTAPDTAVATPSNVAEAADGDAADTDAASAESTPIRVVKTTKIGDNAPAPAQSSDTAPIPSTRPAATPKVAAAPKPTQVATAATKSAPVTTPAPATPKATQVATAATAAPKPAAAPVQKQVASAATSAAPTAASAGGYVMQIASLPSEEEAKRSQANLSAKFGSVIGGHAIEIRKADIAGKGTYYRVRVAAGSKDDAAALCVRFRAAGGTCLISK